MGQQRAATLWSELEHSISTLSPASQSAPIDWAGRQRALQLFDALVLCDARYALGRRAEQSMWSQCHKANLDRLAAKLRMPVKVDVDAATYSMLLHSTYGHLSELLLKLCARYGIKCHSDEISGKNDPSNLMIDVATTSGIDFQAASISEDQREAAESIAYFLLVHIGDVCRYQKHASSARSYYTRAIKLRPSAGHAYNQLGILSSAAGDNLSAVFWYTRAVYCVGEKFEPAAANLDRYYAAILAENSDGGGDKPPSQRNESYLWLQMFASLHDAIYTLGDRPADLLCTRLADELLSDDRPPLAEKFLLGHFLHIFAVAAAFFDKCFEGVVERENIGVLTSVDPNVGLHWHQQYTSIEKCLSAIVTQLLSLLVEHVDENFDPGVHGILVHHVAVLAHWLDKLNADANVRQKFSDGVPAAFTAALVRWRNKSVQPTDINALIGGFEPLFGNSCPDAPLPFSKTLAILAKIPRSYIASSLSSVGAVGGSSSGSGLPISSAATDDSRLMDVNVHGSDTAGKVTQRVAGKLPVRLSASESEPRLKSTPADTGDAVSQQHSAALQHTVAVGSQTSDGRRFEAARLRQALCTPGAACTPAMRASITYADADRMAAAMARFMPPPQLPPRPAAPFFDAPLPTFRPTVPPVFAVGCCSGRSSPTQSQRKRALSLATGTANQPGLSTAGSSGAVMAASGTDPPAASPLVPIPDPVKWFGTAPWSPVHRNVHNMGQNQSLDSGPSGIEFNAAESCQSDSCLLGTWDVDSQTFDRLFELFD